MGGRDESVGHVPAMCTQLYHRCAASALVLEPVVASIRNRSWTLKEIGTQHNAYVDQLLEHLQQLGLAVTRQAATFWLLIWAARRQSLRLSMAASQKSPITLKPPGKNGLLKAADYPSAPQRLN